MRRISLVFVMGVFACASTNNKESNVQGEYPPSVQQKVTTEKTKVPGIYLKKDLSVNLVNALKDSVTPETVAGGGKNIISEKILDNVACSFYKNVKKSNICLVDYILNTEASILVKRYGSKFSGISCSINGNSIENSGKTTIDSATCNLQPLQGEKYVWDGLVGLDFAKYIEASGIKWVDDAAAGMLTGSITLLTIECSSTSDRCFARLQLKTSTSTAILTILQGNESENIFQPDMGIGGMGAFGLIKISCKNINSDSSSGREIVTSAECGLSNMRDHEAR